MNKQNQHWLACFQQIIEKALGKPRGAHLALKFRPLLTAEYQALLSPRSAVKDILQLEQLIVGQKPSVALLRPCRLSDYCRLHFYSLQERYLDEYMPVLENLHLRVLDQVQFTVRIDDAALFIKSFTVIAASRPVAPLYLLRVRLLAAIQAIMTACVENDALNKLLVLNGMAWPEIDVLRAYRNYYLQLRLPVSRASIHRALLNNPQVASCLFHYFEARFRPDSAWDDLAIREEQLLYPIRLQLLDSMTAVADINDDRILRSLFNMIDATMRSNFHRCQPTDNYFLAFKFDSLGIIEMPLPKPQNEIYVHAAGMEGIHLRAGKIARGGIRWSDRPDDFRTEILGLMQTQISKNALIIPTGAKGGFVVKKNGPVDFKAAGQQAYTTLIKALLDLTDSEPQASLSKAYDRVAYDNPDPYLVVAADKGTAKFSDLANSISADYHFWLGDAFASGGSQGYDHKALGITARGAFECIKRHFRELNKDIQTEAFTVMGIGSMDGDVFGNGMLLSPFIRLLAAFSGQHIFIDPEPLDCAAAFQERKRLFDLPGSSWDDYDRRLISEGGGVYSRAAKDIPLSQQLKRWLGIHYKTLDGESLIRYLLTGPIDLLWLGGIGTYVKASTEKHEDVGDRGNDAVRVNASELRASVVGEGANLGFTQKARIEYSLHGGRINTDAVDNSAGVDTSDHEVNLKILLMALQKNKVVDDYRSLFMNMTDAVCQQVLDDNYRQSLCLSLEQIRCRDQATLFLQLADQLELAGFLDKEVEAFPASKEIWQRSGLTLTRPELAVLMAASKRYLIRQLENHADFLDDHCLGPYLEAYFPEQINQPFRRYLSRHPLAREIKATVIGNKIINQAGGLFLVQTQTGENSGLLDLVCSYLAFDQILAGDSIRESVHKLDNKLAAVEQYRMLLQLEQLLLDYCQWANEQSVKIRPDEQTIKVYQAHLSRYQSFLAGQPDFNLPVLMQPYVASGVAEALAEKLVLMDRLWDFPRWVLLSRETGMDFIETLQRYLEISDLLGVSAIIAQLAQFIPHDSWERRLFWATQQDFKDAVCVIVRSVLRDQADKSRDYFRPLKRSQQLSVVKSWTQEIRSAAPTSLMPYLALARAINKLARL